MGLRRTPYSPNIHRLILKLVNACEISSDKPGTANEPSHAVKGASGFGHLFEEVGGFESDPLLLFRL